MYFRYSCYRIAACSVTLCSCLPSSLLNRMVDSTQSECIIHFPSQYSLKLTCYSWGTVSRLHSRKATIDAQVTWFCIFHANFLFHYRTNIILSFYQTALALFLDWSIHYFRELIHNDSLRNKQIVAAGEVLKLLSPSKENMKILAQEGLKCSSPICTPSMIAASTILYYERTQEVGWNQPIFQQWRLISILYCDLFIVDHSNLLESLFWKTFLVRLKYILV